MTISLIFFAATANAVPASFNYQGRILKNNGTPLEYNNVNFLFQVVSPDGTCVLYQEQRSAVNMTNSAGIFDLPVGTNSVQYISTGYPNFLDVFQNTGNFECGSCVLNSGNYTCSGSGTFYNAVPLDIRKLRVSFFDGSGWQIITPDNEIRSVPFSAFAQSAAALGSTLEADILTKALAPTCVAANSFLQWNGTDFDCVAVSGLSASPTGTAGGDLGGTYPNPSVTRIQGQAVNSAAPTAAGQVLIWSGSEWQANNIRGEDIRNAWGGTQMIPSTACLANQSMTWSVITDRFTCQNIGSLGAAAISTGVIAPARLGTGTADTTTFLRGDGAWTAVNANPAGNTGQIQFNNAGAFAANTELHWDQTNKRLGVGTAVPVASIETAGEIKVGSTALTCTVASRGAIRYNNGTSVLEFCNGTSWNLIQAAACSDAEPNVFSFNDEANATISTVYESNILQISGINCTVPVTISGGGSPQFQICSDAACASVVQSWTSSPSSIVSGQYLQVRLTTDIVGGAQFKSTVIIGSTASVWTVTNAGGDCTGSPAIGTVCADGTLYAGLTPDGGVKMFTTRCDAGQTWDGVSTCTGTRLLPSYNNGSFNFIANGTTSSTAGRANTTILSGLADAGAPYQTAEYCDNLVENGHSDWYLPAANEAVLLYSNRNVLRNFIGSRGYHTSTELDASRFCAVLFNSNGDVFCLASKTINDPLRCVRR